MNAKTPIATAWLCLCACGGSVTVGQLPAEAGVDATTASASEAGPLQDAGASVPSVDATTAEAGAAMCQGPNSMSCAGRPDACSPGYFCDTDRTRGCASSYCNCDRQGVWSCTTDCVGGVCLPVEDAGDAGAEAAIVDAANATRCCHIGVLYISCSSCTQCDEAGAPLPGNPNWCAYYPDVCCPPGRLDLCGPCPPDAEALDAADAEASTDATDAGDGATDADAAPMCCRGTPLTCVPGGCPIGAE